MSDFLCDLNNSRILTKIVAEIEKNKIFSIQTRIKLSDLIDCSLIFQNTMTF